jgi:hypothetical protein
MSALAVGAGVGATDPGSGSVKVILVPAAAGCRLFARSTDPGKAAGLLGLVIGVGGRQGSDPGVALTAAGSAASGGRAPGSKIALPWPWPAVAVAVRVCGRVMRRVM